MSDLSGPQSVDEFDLDAWVKGVALPERTVEICGRPDLIAEHEAAVKALERARQTRDDDRLGGSVKQAAGRVRDLEQQMSASTRTFRVRALTREEGDAVDATSEDDRALVWVQTATIDPKFTLEQVRELRDRLGPQWVAWLNMCTAVQSEKVSVPFSFAASGILGRQDS